MKLNKLIFLTVFITVFITVLSFSCSDSDADSDNDGFADDSDIISELQTDDKAESDQTEDIDIVEEPEEDQILCCIEIVKEWWRCEGINENAASECTECVKSLTGCEEFTPKDESWSCSDSCNLICEEGTVEENADDVGKGTGKTRKALAREYCINMLHGACDYEPIDFEGLGTYETVEACYEM